MKLKVYHYPKCSTCVKALKYLDRRKISYDSLAIVETPPSIKELKQMLSIVKSDGGKINKLFNTSGEVYRSMKLGDKLADMTEEEALKLLAANGKLIKRPFVLAGTTGAVGFKEEQWDELF